LDEGAIKAAWSTMQKLYAADLPVIPLYFRAEPYVMPKWLKGLRPTGHQVTSTNWVEDWYVEP
jgi:peptide/nickel transport system substrate-binding protein